MTIEGVAEAKIEGIEGLRGGVPRRIHQGSGPRYVLAGKIKIADKDGVRVYSPGEVFWAMVAENAADITAVLLIFEVAHKGP